MELENDGTDIIADCNNTSNLKLYSQIKNSICLNKNK